MEGNYLTPGDLALWENRRYEGRDGHRGTSVTALGIAAGAIVLGFAAAWGVNLASKARSDGHARAIDLLANQALVERQSRESWQNQHAPTMTQYVDVRTGAAAGAGSNALATAEALALIANGNSRSGQVCPQPVALYQPAMPCSCNTCGN